ncbi:ComEC/Rec2 family competence protein [Kitasatospora sp. NPDC017646]|uniref:ComEC/Rec2 family competence protein n=1 Tax=Kitasatospora sp. NPDC017646 TaxID=3364024 RepID=UPI0037B9B6D7
MTEAQQILCTAQGATPDTAEVLILDVGHGNSAVLREGDRCVIVDAKSDKLLYRTLIDTGIRRIEHLVLSHADTDHIQGALRLLTLEKFQIGTVWANSDSTKDTKKWDELLAVLSDRADAGIFSVRIGISNADGSQLSLDRIGIEILHPTLRDIGHGPGSRGRFRPEITTNGMSVVLHVTLEGNPALLLPGDINSSGFEEMARRAKTISSHVLVYPHHGGHSDSTEEGEFAKLLCDVVEPKVVLFSMGRGNYENPLPEVVEKIKTSFPEVRMACTQLSRHCHSIVPSQVPRDYLLSRPSAGRALGTCCAGTVRITIRDGDVVVDPPRDKHRAWIRENVNSPMCTEGSSLPHPRLP